MDIRAPNRMSATPRATKGILAGVLLALLSGLGAFAVSSRSDSLAALLLGFLTALFGARIGGQVLVALRAPAWLPAMEDWNFVPYRILLPVQLALLGLMCALCVAVARGWEMRPAEVLVAAALLYWMAMVVRYALRMRRPAERWFGGTIPIVFHCVLAGYLFVLGLSVGTC
jgi:hypothetical protein